MNVGLLQQLILAFGAVGEGGSEEQKQTSERRAFAGGL